MVEWQLSLLRIFVCLFWFFGLTENFAKGATQQSKISHTPKAQNV